MTRECPVCFVVDAHAGYCPARHLTAAPAAPTVHLNGTSWGELYDALDAAMAALRDAEDALMKTAPNGRDYYVQGSEALGKAHVEHRARVEKLVGVRAEVELIAERVSAQERKR